MVPKQSTDSFRVARPLALGALALALAGCVSEVGDGSEPVEESSEAVVHPAIHVGVRCQADYQNAWQNTWDNYEACWGFGNKMSQHNYWDYYYNTHGARGALISPYDDCLGCGGPDAVDFFYISSHGGYDANAWYMPMWDQNTWIASTELRLGDNGQRASVLTAYACNTMVHDGGEWTRWGAAFRGGLRIAGGAHGLMWNGGQGHGADFAWKIEDAGDTIANSWVHATWDADHRNRPSAMTAGVDATDCWNRMGANQSTVYTEPRLSDWNIGYYCWISLN